MSATVRDLFCGAGGSSLGGALAGCELKHALNHDPRSIETHALNFQDADHSCADIHSLSTAQIRRFDPTDILWASPECTNHSLAKGGQRRPLQAASLWEDGPAGDAEQDRSRATMWDVVRFCEQSQLRGHPYKAVIVENVVDVVKWGHGDDGGLFSAWLTAMRALGYEHECVYLNSMICWPTPQSRDRVYVVFWLRTLRAPDLRFEPRSWCPRCEQLVDGRQTWKRPGGHPALGRVWGRYGAQYFYTCPACHKAVLPAVFPAASIIDRALIAERIGEKKPAKCRKCGLVHPLACPTRDRIRRGLERLAREPFAIRLMHGGAPKPLTLPVITLTRRHDMAMVLPVAGNTFERTSGNRARDARLVPLDTVHTTLERAMVIPPMNDTDPRDADLEPVPTQTTTTRPRLVMANTENGVPRPADRDPAQTLRTEGGLSFVYANRAHSTPAPEATSPTHALCTGGHLAIVRNNTARGDTGQMTTPAHEPIRTLTTAGHQSLLVPHSSAGIARESDHEPAPSVTTHNKLAVVVPYTRTGEARWADEQPMPTMTTRDRAAVLFTEDDIDDCLFRMFALHEIAGAMVMHDHVDGNRYEVTGNKREQMAQYGNAVTPPAARELIGRVLEILA